MAVPARPIAGAPLESAWGQVAHDAVVAQDIQTGIGQVTFVASQTQQVVVVFPRPFASPPTVMANITTANRLWNVGVAAVTTTQMVVTVGHVDNVSSNSVVGFTWLAYGPRA